MNPDHFKILPGLNIARLDIPDCQIERGLSRGREGFTHHFTSSFHQRMGSSGESGENSAWPRPGQTTVTSAIVAVGRHGKNQPRVELREITFATDDEAHAPSTVEFDRDLCSCGIGLSLPSAERDGNVILRRQSVALDPDRVVHLHGDKVRSAVVVEIAHGISAPGMLLAEKCAASLRDILKSPPLGIAKQFGEPA